MRLKRINVLNRVASYLLLFVFLCLGTGGAEYAHNLQHAAEDAREDALAAISGHPSQEHHHDESNCAVHAQLHITFVSLGWVPFLVSLGLFVAFLTQISTPLIPRMVPARADCRDPPTCFLAL